ncbi:N2,N2-dimethylguanosine tRNA methyltransferase [Nitrosotalea sinensis]|uniref:tRNA (guanine(26)-N(2))-dimethyltransferase n=1 Tax=Nitrosotalea sinensis TaxID=1499975 RepID=A0A2H1EGH0_9ARCH|nr:tRNA (guanine-N1)-methyltransferase [Candidatus Nitrosotalea sinensis]SHO45120.1 N2,N2-dimethylguanosine tRNA methyltransferase [Candidatus Nitrosotalea sinensis]
MLESELAEITEGSTRLLVPKDSLSEEVPPKEPAFFNPRARVSRDFSIIAYSAFVKNFKGPKIFLDSLAGIGARSVRVANEIPSIEKSIANDVNPQALEIGKKIAQLNNVTNCEFSENEACRFLSLHSTRDGRGAIVDVDPFGSPSRYLDCAMRATFHGGLLSVTATDMTVLHGIFPEACQRKYYGTPVRTIYGNEIALRLILGCMNMVAGRLDIMLVPLFVQHSMHYYKAYTKVLVKTNTKNCMGYILHCHGCGNRKVVQDVERTCNICNSKAELAGPLWIDSMYDKDFIDSMISEEKNLKVDKSCSTFLEKCKEESGMPPAYFALDELGQRKHSAPPSLGGIIEKLQKSGFRATRTSMNPSGVKTDAKIDEILALVP